MTQEVETLVRQRIRSLRIAKGWSLDALATRCHLSPSSLSRIETGHRRISLDQLLPIARALDTSVEALLATGDDADDVVIHPVPETSPGRTVWLLSRERDAQGVTVAKMRIEPDAPDSDTDTGTDTPARERGVHPGREWFTVLSGTVQLRLGERTILVRAGNAAEFDTMTPHAISAHGGPVEILSIFDRDGRAAHLDGH